MKSTRLIPLLSVILTILVSGADADIQPRLGLIPLAPSDVDAAFAQAVQQELLRQIELSGWAELIGAEEYEGVLYELRYEDEELRYELFAEVAAASAQPDGDGELELLRELSVELDANYLLWGELVGGEGFILNLWCYQRLSREIILKFSQSVPNLGELDEACHQAARRLAAGPGGLPVTTADDPPQPRSGYDPGRLAYSRYQGEVYLIDADGVNERQLTINMRSEGWTPTASLSPDGSQVAFSSARDGDGEIYLINVDGTGLTKLTNNEHWDDYPNWGADGGHIAFYSQPDDEVVINALDLETGEERLISEGFVAQRSPSWSPDGSLIAFYDPSGEGELSIMRATASQSRWLSNDSTDDWAPAWSPDGAFIAFSSYRDGNLELYLVDEYGRNPRRLTENTIRDFSPCFSGDGRFLFFQQGRDVRGQLYSLELETDTIRKLTLYGGCHPSWGPSYVLPQEQTEPVEPSETTADDETDPAAG